jgi:hypothetical protein
MQFAMMQSYRLMASAQQENLSEMIEEVGSR